MNDIAKYKLELISKNKTYTKCRIDNLDMAYYKCSYNGELQSFSGICGLLRCKEYPGYCFLCMTYHSNELTKSKYIVEFSPLYNKEGQIILIEYDHDDVCTFINRGYEDYRINKLIDC